MNNEQRNLLFTPGPLNTSETVKRAMLSDYGSREPAFIELVGGIRSELLEIAGVSQDSGFEAVPIQGSGTFGIESVVGSIVPRGGKLLTIVNGAYGRRIDQIARCLDISADCIEFEETTVADVGRIDDLLASDSAITHVAAVHCETTTGILNPIESIAKVVADHRRTFIVDAMSSFGGIPMDLSDLMIDVLVSSANKCLEGVPGFSFALCRRSVLEDARGNARSVSLDLTAQWDALEGNGQFRFTPPTHVLLAFQQALVELREEGGVDARHRRYQENCDTLIAGMGDLGFTCLLANETRSPVITAFAEPDDLEFQFETFYERLSERRLIIYPGKLSKAASFRIGTIGKIDSRDVVRLVTGIGEALSEMKVSLKS